MAAAKEMSADDAAVADLSELDGTKKMAWKAFLFTQPDFFHFLFKSWHRGSPRGHETCQVSTLA